MTVAEYDAFDKSDNDDDDSNGGRIQELCDTGTKKLEDNKQFRLDVGLHTVNNETKDSETLCSRWKISQESRKKGGNYPHWSLAMIVKTGTMCRVL